MRQKERRFEMKVRTEFRLYLAIFFVLCPDILWAEYVPVETARQVAVNSLNKSILAKALQHWQKESPGVEFEQRAVPKMTEEQIIETFPATENDILVYYVFNFSPEGWAIISADDAAYPVIAYSESGFYDPNVFNQPPALTAWMDNVAEEIADAVARGLQGLPDAAAAWKHFSVAPDNFLPDLGDLATAQSVPPLIQSTWGQGDPDDWVPWDIDSYNQYCPWEYSDWTHIRRLYCLTGCVATAMAQIMRYWQWPLCGQGRHGYDPPYDCSHECLGFDWREVDFSQQYYDWTSMPLNGPSNAIAILMRDIGVAVNMNYTPSVSGAYAVVAPFAYRDYFRYNAGPIEKKSNYFIPDWINKLKAELDVGRPILYVGFDESGNSSHAFVCDGYDSSGYFHFNWGWDGDYDGYFTVDDLTPGGHNYSNYQDAVFGIEPNKPLEVYADDNYNADGFNDGHLWFIDAFNSIQLAILVVRPGGTVYVAAGTYNEAIDFKGKAIHLYSIGGPDVTIINGSGHYHVVQCVNGEGPDAILEGFTITGGNANGSWPNNHGGGMWNNLSSPTVINCIFRQNSANEYGGGMFNHYCSPTVTNCTFISNTSNNHGGGMYNYYSNPTVTGCTFTGNNGSYDGGGMHNYYSSPTVTNCTFSGNAAAEGGGMSNWFGSSTVTDCTFISNSGGGMFNDGGSPMMTNCTFSANYARAGGGMCNYNGSSPTVTNCSFSGNSAIKYGGGMYNYNGSSPMVFKCTFSDNKVTGEGGGGGIYNEQSSPTLTGCTFRNNQGNYYGGGMFNSVRSNPKVTNCSFTGNSAQEGGGGMCNVMSEPTLTNCTFRGNSAVSFGGGMFNGYSYPMVTNCIFWDDTPNEMYNPFSSPIVTYSDVKGTLLAGTGNINSDPLFVDAIAGNLRLRPGSPCIDKGSNAAVPSGITTDLDGQQRIIDGDCNDIDVVDIGAYEFDLAYFGDFDDDCSVNFGDVSILARAWMIQKGEPGWDGVCDIRYPHDDYIDWRDLAIFCDNWLASTEP
jgi:hypothetical protein